MRGPYLHWAQISINQGELRLRRGVCLERRGERVVGIVACGGREGGALSVFLIVLRLGSAIREEAFRGREAGGDSLEIDFFRVFLFRILI